MSLGINVGGAQDFEVIKSDDQVEIDESGSEMKWNVAGLTEEGSAVVSFAFSRLSFDEIFPINVKFVAPYSLIDVCLESVENVENGEPMTSKSSACVMTETYRVNNE